MLDVPLLLEMAPYVVAQRLGLSDIHIAHQQMRSENLLPRSDLPHMDVVHGYGLEVLFHRINQGFNVDSIGHAFQQRNQCVSEDRERAYQHRSPYHHGGSGIQDGSTNPHSDQYGGYKNNQRGNCVRKEMQKRATNVQVVAMMIAEEQRRYRIRQNAMPATIVNLVRIGSGCKKQRTACLIMKMATVASTAAFTVAANTSKRFRPYECLRVGGREPTVRAKNATPGQTRRRDCGWHRQSAQHCRTIPRRGSLSMPQQHSGRELLADVPERFAGSRYPSGICSSSMIRLNPAEPRT